MFVKAMIDHQKSERVAAYIMFFFFLLSLQK